MTELLHVSRGEVLIVRVPSDQPPQSFDELVASLERRGLHERVMVVYGDLFQPLAVIEQGPPATVPSSRPSLTVVEPQGVYDIERVLESDDELE